MDIILLKVIHVTCVDLFKPYLSDRTINVGQFVETTTRFGITPYLTVLIGDSPRMASMVDDKSLDCVFIDADHSYEGCMADIVAWEPKIRPGGYIGGHDYSEPGVIQAVDERYPACTHAPDSTIWLMQI